MSESEGELDFQSADEGDDEKTTSKGEESSVVSATDSKVEKPIACNCSTVSAEDITSPCTLHQQNACDITQSPEKSGDQTPKSEESYCKNLPPSFIETKEDNSCIASDLVVDNTSESFSSDNTTPESAISETPVIEDFVSTTCAPKVTVSENFVSETSFSENSVTTAQKGFAIECTETQSPISQAIEGTEAGADSEGITQLDLHPHANSEVNKIGALFDKLSFASNTRQAPDCQHSEQEEKILDKLASIGQQKSAGGWSSWGGWGASLINTAASSLQTFTGQVSDGMHTVVETIEASIGAQPPAKLASEISLFVKEPEEEPVTSEPHSSPSVTDSDVGELSSQPENTESGDGTSEDWMRRWGVSSISNTIQSTTKTLVESGLDVLETIGKKTMESIKESDPGYMKTKSLFKGNQPNLSQLLREAKSANEELAASSDEKMMACYSVLFDQHQGLAHLEALEMLSISSMNKLTAAGDLSDDLQEALDGIDLKFSDVYTPEEDGEENDFVAGIDDAFNKITLAVKKHKITECQSSCRAWILDCQSKQDAGERIEGHTIHQRALSDFSLLTSSAIELYHKAGEQLLLTPDLQQDMQVDLILDSFSSVLRLVSNELLLLSKKFTDLLNTAADDSEDPDSINPLITNVFLEASNSTSYVRDAFKLLHPVLKQCVIVTYSANS